MAFLVFKKKNIPFDLQFDPVTKPNLNEIYLQVRWHTPRPVGGRRGSQTGQPPPLSTGDNLTCEEFWSKCDFLLNVMIDCGDTSDQRVLSIDVAQLCQKEKSYNLMIRLMSTPDVAKRPVQENPGAEDGKQWLI